MKALNTVWFVHAAVLLVHIFKELAKELVESSSRYICHLTNFNQSFTFFPSYFVFFIGFDDLSAAMKSDHLVLDSSNLRRARLSLLLVFFQILLETNSKVMDICC